MQAIYVTELRFISLTVTKKTIISFMPAVLVTAGIALLSLWENPQLPPSIAADDKIVHGLMYMCLAVGDMAFHACSCLREIRYAGTAEQWDAVDIGEDAIPEKVEILFEG